MILEIERLWGQEPGWFGRQDRDDQVRLMAWYRVHGEPVKRRRGRREPRDPRNRNGG